MQERNDQNNKTQWTARLKGVLVSPALLFWTLPYLMLLLIIGTLEQTKLGLYAAQHKFFGSLFFMLGPVPLPGGVLICALLFINLAAKFLLESEWSKARVGIHLAHLGVLVMLMGGLISNVSRQEWAMTLPPGEEVSEASDYFESELVLLKNDTPLAEIPFEDLKEGMALFEDKAPFDIKLINLCRSCQVVLRDEAADQGATGEWRGPSAKMALVEGEASLKAEENLQGLSFHISRLDSERDGNYVTFLFFPKPPLWKIGEDRYSLVVQRKMHILPFSLELLDFQAVYYPGTQMARSYSSDVQVKYGNELYPAHIAMNEPLSTDLYTVYQSSFFQNQAGESVSVLTVVKNRGRYFPYIGTGLVAFGLILYVFMRARRVKEGVA
jgi:hypothetical protein